MLLVFREGAFFETCMKCSGGLSEFWRGDELLVMQYGLKTLALGFFDGS